MLEDLEDIINIEDLNDKDSEQKTIKENNENEQNMMSEAVETNDKWIKSLTPEETEDFYKSYKNDTTDDDNNNVVDLINKAIDKNKSKYEDSIKESNLSVVIELLNSIAGLLLAAPVDYKNNVISSFADDIAEMRDNGRRIFRDKEQVLTFLNGILSGSLHRQPQRVKESIKNDKLTRNIILNPKLKNRKPRPFTKKNNYVYKGNSLKTVI